jgi:hypothetical protein
MKDWKYKSFEIKEGLKPGSSSFRYFYSVSEGSEKKCRYCVWIDPDALARFDPSKNFDSIASSHSEKWGQWVKAKIDQGDFRNRVLKHDANGESEIDLDEMDEKLV